MDESDYEDHDDGPRYLELDEIEPSALASSLRGLHLLGDHPSFSTQSFNLGVVDMFITELEYDVLRRYQPVDEVVLPTGRHSI